MPTTFHHLLHAKTLKLKKKLKKSRLKNAYKTSKSQIDKTPLNDEEEENELGFKLKSNSDPHSHSIQPLGNLFLANQPNIRNSGLGSLQIFPDDLIIDILAFLDANSLSVLSVCSKSLYVFSTHDPLWRNLTLDVLKGDFDFNGSWRSTFVTNCGYKYVPCSKFRVRNFYSDYLFQSWLCANLEMKYVWLDRDNIDRRRGISVDEFVSCFEEKNKPVLLEGCIDNWPALKKWSREHLVQVCGEEKFAVGPVDMKLDKFFRYSDLAKEERPLYLFDSKFVERVPKLGLDYEVPIYFREDLFSVLGKERPDYRWIIIGPAGSGSSFHVDPNSTSAWNAIIKGSKKWVMFPPDVVPPGVHPSPDGAEVACPVSIMEWFMNFYDACKNWERRPVECICKAGEVVFVPNGWWHLVINLEDSIAITQNYVSRRNLLNVLDFLKKPNASELVSGTKDRVNLHDRFKNAINATFPGTIDKLTLEAQEKMKNLRKKQNFWETASSEGFKFSF